jgi:uncharacterized protein (DUF1501 family)
MKRRDFIRKAGLATAGTFMIPLFLKGWDLEAAQKLKNSNKKLVIIQFSGGNDGLNTVVPFGNDLYYQKRPKISIPQREVIKLSDSQGLNPALSKLERLYKEGDFCIVNNVGYPNPDRSHFRSMDIWQTASKSDEYLSTGWIGRYLDGFGKSELNAHYALEMDDTLSLAMKGDSKSGFATNNFNLLKRTTNTPIIKALANHHSHEHSEQVSYLYQTLANTVSSADYLFEKERAGKSTANYPQNSIGKDLQQIAKLINADSDTQIYYVSLGGFDTHANQRNKQERLLKNYAEALSAFRTDLKKEGNWDETLVMTFSEFGRRVAQNGSGGTDHGTANIVFLAGGKLKKQGFVGTPPNLTDLDNGDLKYKIDFRQIYSDLLKNWLETNSTKVLNEEFKSLGLV